ncbi:hypothetical protein MMC10_005651 [Thelotrema lepadinum]|nr:hypothetical protein [Thelotrema lepadinum]
MENFRVRASSLLSTSPFRNRTASPANRAVDSPRNGEPPSPSLLAKGQVDKPTKGNTADAQLAGLTPGHGDGSSEAAAVVNEPSRRAVRVIPTWVHFANEDDEDDEADADSNLLPKSPRHPPDAQIAHHNHTPTFLIKSKPEPGRLHDAERESVPPTPRYHVTEMGFRWRQFAEWSAYPRDSEEHGEQVTEDWLVQNGPDYSQPWRTAEDEKSGSPEDKRRAQQKAWWTRAQHTLLRNPVIPLVFRLMVGALSVAALVLGANIYSNIGSTLVSNSDPECRAVAEGLKTSPLMAIVVDAVALVYLILITRDEYSGQPLGLRSAKSKVRLIMLDLFFIVFDSANLSLAFEAVTTLSTSCSERFGISAIGGLNRMDDDFYDKYIQNESRGEPQLWFKVFSKVCKQVEYGFAMKKNDSGTTHEVLCIGNGKARLCFGGEDNPEKIECVVNKGDVIIVPAGVSHRLLDDLDGGFEMVGSYPKGKQWDMCYGREGEEDKIEGIRHLT